MVHIARGLAWSWAASSTLVNRRSDRWPQADIPFERVIKTTYPSPAPRPTPMMEHAMAQRNRAFSTAALNLTHPNAAGIDIGSASHFVAVPPDRDEQPERVNNFETPGSNSLVSKLVWFPLRRAAVSAS